MSSARWRRMLRSERGLTLALGLASVGLLVCVGLLPDSFPVTLLMVPLLLGILLLSRRRMVRFAYFTVLCLTAATILQSSYEVRVVSALAVMYAVCLAVIITGRRATLGVGRLQGESMLVDLRDRILAQAELPPLPAPWQVESALSSAGGSPFAGDFVVATRRHQGRSLEVVVVDVSGKGEQAGTRALQLSGAMSGLIGALPPAEFLPAANEYLLQREWEEGFATAVHLSLNLESGRFEVRTAGHPPAVQRHAGSGRWEPLRSEGPVLGLVPDVEYDAIGGRLDPGDALLLYTDGMVERPSRDIELGIDAMMGAAERLVIRSWDRLAERLVSSVGSPDDDRALLLVHHQLR
ncbi:serine/threonine-protein phosphatase [Nocardioides sp. GY 10113]|uniref:PP2C family protein-serine/threonine phosphatase n=1 Tax=Nocardioides sp. GY 10113 TaxID=2569761 RepID=UPI0010A772EB|nr:PP2C family protein-serine/threonine phosphatase [Nocardioides sp. GY 10113]TIC86747.1 serine/threonine-protein phosphatase [Nocardioides sp. GY 10113]